MAKIVNMQVYKSGRVRRWGFYDDLRAVACAKALLEESPLGWIVGEVKHLREVDRYKLFAEIPPQVTNAQRQRKAVPLGVVTRKTLLQEAK